LKSLLFQSLTIDVGVPTSKYVSVFWVGKPRQPLLLSGSLLHLRQRLQFVHEAARIDDGDFAPFDARGECAIGGNDVPAAARRDAFDDQIIRGSRVAEDHAYAAEVLAEMLGLGAVEVAGHLRPVDACESAQRSHELPLRVRRKARGTGAAKKVVSVDDPAHARRLRTRW